MDKKHIQIRYLDYFLSSYVNVFKIDQKYTKNFKLNGLSCKLVNLKWNQISSGNAIIV